MISTRHIARLGKLVSSLHITDSAACHTAFGRIAAADKLL